MRRLLQIIAFLYAFESISDSFISNNVFESVSLMKAGNADALDQGEYSETTFDEDAEFDIEDFLNYTKFDEIILTPSDGLDDGIVSQTQAVFDDTKPQYNVTIGVSDDQREEGIRYEPEEILFNKYKCMLVVKFEIDFLQNPLLNNSGFISYIKDIEISGTGETKIIDEQSNTSDRYIIIKNEAKSKKLEKVVTFLKRVLETCNVIKDQEKLYGFKKSINYAIYRTKDEIEKLEKKQLKLEREEFADSEKHDKTLEDIWATRGKIDALSMALRSLVRIKDYWIHLENLPSVI